MPYIRYRRQNFHKGAQTRSGDYLIYNLNLFLAGSLCNVQGELSIHDAGYYVFHVWRYKASGQNSTWKSASKSTCACFQHSDLIQSVVQCPCLVRRGRATQNHARSSKVWICDPGEWKCGSLVADKYKYLSREVYSYHLAISTSKGQNVAKYTLTTETAVHY